MAISRINAWGRCLLALALVAARAAPACDAQVTNPVFSQAKSDVGRMKAEGKLTPAQTQEWAELEAEQRRLWERAGRIDGECREGRLSDDAVPYNMAVLEWEARLRQFLRETASPGQVLAPATSEGPPRGVTPNEVSFPGAPAPIASAKPQPHKKETPAAPNGEPPAPRLLLN